jgi:hypothetical protein
MKRAQWIPLVLAVGCMLSIPAAADTIYNNFNTGDTYNCCSGWDASGPDGPNGQVTNAQEFTANVSAFVTQIDLGISLLQGDGGGTAALYTVGGNDSPGTLLGSWDFTTHQNFGDCCAVETISINSGPMLRQGTDYFMVLSAGGENVDVWNDNTTGAHGHVLISRDNGNFWFDQGFTGLSTFRVEGIAVPEPGTLVMMGSGVLAAAAGLRRKFNV